MVGSETRALVVGLGRSGIAVVKLLYKLGAEVRATDSAALDTLDSQFLNWVNQHGVTVECGAHNDRLLDNIDLLVVSPGVPLDLPLLVTARKRGVAVIGEMALAAGLVSTPIIAITGTNGKSTVTELVGEMFKAAGRSVFVGGNLGQPLSEYLLEPFAAEVLVLEVSSFQLDTAPDFRPAVAVLLNISPDHLDRYDDYAHYAASKFAIFAGQTQLDAAVINIDDPEISARLTNQNFVSQSFFFGCNCGATDNGARINGQEVVVKTAPDVEAEYYSLVDSVLGYEPNIHNVAAAIIAASLLDCPPGGIRQAIAEFKPLGHRLEKVAEIDGVLYLDDSKATNIGAVGAALAGMDRPTVLIGGGRDKGGDYKLLGKIVQEKVKGMILIGEAKEKMAAVFGDLTEVVLADDMGEAVSLAATMAVSGDVVLLSPACASFDMFSSYGQRGQVFKDAVHKLRGSQMSARKI